MRRFAYPSNVSIGLVVAVDGPGGSGKSTVARALARRLGLRYLDTGAMYRALTWLALQRGIATDDAEALADLARSASLAIGTDPDAPTVMIEDVDVAGPIRGPDVTAAVSAVSAVPAVREQLVALQRTLIAVAAGSSAGIVAEGRDIGTVVAPDAPIKVFLTATQTERARRRANENAADTVSTQRDLARRDRLDSSRAASPLAQAPDALVVDSTAMAIDEVVEMIVERCQHLASVSQ
jgi:cytidylate kinase